MELQFEKLAKRILGEGIGDPDSAKHFSGGSEKRGHHDSMGSDDESGVSPESVRKADRNHGEKPSVSFNRWTVKDPKTGKTYTFAEKPGASQRAEELAKKLGSKAIWRSKHH